MLLWLFGESVLFGIHVFGGSEVSVVFLPLARTWYLVNLCWWDRRHSVWVARSGEEKAFGMCVGGSEDSVVRCLALAIRSFSFN